MLTIGHLRLALPPAFEARSREIARLVGDELAAVSLPSDVRLDRVVLPSLEVAAGATDAEVAAAVGLAISTHLHQHVGGAP